MGIGEAFGVKIEKLELKGTYTVEELFDQIKDVEFEAGKPDAYSCQKKSSFQLSGNQLSGTPKSAIDWIDCPILISY